MSEQNQVPFSLAHALQGAPYGCFPRTIEPPIRVTTPEAGLFHMGCAVSLLQLRLYVVELTTLTMKYSSLVLSPYVVPEGPTIWSPLLSRTSSTKSEPGCQFGGRCGHPCAINLAWPGTTPTIIGDTEISAFDNKKLSIVVLSLRCTRRTASSIHTLL